MFLWSPAMLAAAPIGFLALLSYRSLLKKPYVVRIAVALFLLTLPWLLIFISVSKVGSFLATKAESTHVQAVADNNSAIKRREPFTLKNTLDKLSGASVPMNPLFIVFTVPALF